MRIGLNVPDPQSILAEKANKPSTTATQSSTPSGRLTDKTASGVNVTLSALATQALAAPEVREEKVRQLQQQIAEGQYQASPNQSAEAILGQ